MSWVLLHDKNNWLRTGRASITDAPPPVFGYSLDALTDGVQAIPYRGVGIATKRIEITLSGGGTPSFISVHDVQIYGAEVTGITIYDYFSGWSTRREFSSQEVARAGGSVGAYGIFRAGIERIRVRIWGSSSAEFSIGEICVGVPSVGSSSTTNVLRQRRLSLSRKWNTIGNGPWRTKLAEDRRAYSIEFPPSFQDALEEQLAASEGGLRPVSFMPDASGPLAIHGHLSDEHVSVVGPGEIYEGLSLQVQESMRPLRGQDG